MNYILRATFPVKIQSERKRRRKKGKEEKKKGREEKKKLFGHDREATPGSKICWRGSHKQY